MNPRLTWDRMKWRQHMSCRVCGATRDYLERTRNEVTCTLCGNKWFSVDRELVIVDN